MNKEILNNVFNETYMEVIENLKRNGEKKFSKYNGLDELQTFSMMYTDILVDSTRFIQTVFEKLFDSDDFKRDLFNDMMEWAEKERQRTGNNPFGV